MDSNDLDYDKITEILEKHEEEQRTALRRKKKRRASLATILSLIPWVIMIAVWGVIETASPGREMRFFTTFFAVNYGTEPLVRGGWNTTLIYVAYILMLVSLGLCLIAFTVNILGKKREGESLRISVFIIGAITITAFIFFIINFWQIIF